MKTLTPKQREKGFIELEGVLGPDAHLMSFLSGIAHAEKVLSDNPADEEPVAWLSPTSSTFSTVETSHHTAPLFLHPAPRKDFVRLSQEEIQTIYLTRYDTPNLFARAIEDALEEKNK